MGSLSKKRVVNPVLTELARGYSNAAMIADAIFPMVSVSKEAGKIPEFTKEAFKIYSTERAIRANSNRINPDDRNEIDFVCVEHDLEYPVDYREQEDDVFDTQKHATFVVSEAIALRREKLCADIAQATGNYGSNTATLGAGDKFTNTSSNPFTAFKNASEAIRAGIAKRPNVVIIGATAFAALKEHPALMERLKYTQTGLITPDILATMLDVEKVFVGDSIYVTDAGVNTDIWSDNVIVAYVPSLKTSIPRSIYEPSFGYTLRKKNQPIVDTYSENGKVLLVRSTDIFVPKLVGSDAGYLIYDTNA